MAHFLPYCRRVRRPASFSLSSFVTKWGSRISREHLHLESPNFTRIFTPVGSTYSHTWYDVTIYFQSIDVRKTAENDASDGFNLDSQKMTHTSTPTSWTAIPDMTSLTNSGWKLSKFKKRSKMSPQTASGWNFSRKVRPAKQSNNSANV